MNCHFAVYHVADLIRQHGPLRYYSCRSLERTIKLYSNKVFSMSKPNKEISNIHTRFNFFNQTDVTEAFDQISSPETNIRNDYHDHPSQPDRWPQLWEKFSNVSLNREDIVVDVPVPVCVDALQRFYNRLGLSSIVNYGEKIMLAARMLHNGFVFQSRWYRQYQSQIRRANHLVLFEAKHITRYLPYSS